MALYNSSWPTVNPNGSEKFSVDTGGPQLLSAYTGSLLGIIGSSLQTSTATAAITATTAQLGGTGKVPAADVTLQMTGSTSGNVALTTPTVAAMLAAFPNWVVGQSYSLTISNQGSGNNWTLTAGTGWTLAGGSAAVANNTWRKFVVTLTSATAITATMVAVGTYS